MDVVYITCAHNVRTHVNRTPGIRIITKTKKYTLRLYRVLAIRTRYNTRVINQRGYLPSIVLPARRRRTARVPSAAVRRTARVGNATFFF